MAIPRPSSPAKMTSSTQAQCYDIGLDSDHDPLEQTNDIEILSRHASRSWRKPLLWRVSPVVWVSAVVCFLVVSISIFLVLSPDGTVKVPEAQADESRTESLPHLQNTQSADTEMEEEDRPLVLYAYYETDNALQNARFFIKHGLHAQADFIFILNGEGKLRYDIPTVSNIKIVQRNNTCFDLGAHAEVLTRNDNELINKYKRFILMNASIRGPFLPTWSRECWTDAWLAKVTDTNKLVGMTFNCQPTHHVQSMIFATDRIGLNLLLPVIKPCFADFKSAIKAETECTAAVVEGGYNVSAFMTAFSSDDKYATTCTHGDVLLDGSYYGTTIHPYESMFQKANRDFAKKQLRLLTEWHNKSGYSSWEVCRKANHVKRVLRAMKIIRGFDLDFSV